jgi:diaminohydroxyphosphoribosylaminopyrimidine deaminase/5-amino-6-(5-phosphoribosylamino)uracil reductase
MTNRFSAVQTFTGQTAEWTETDRRMMTRALELAEMGAGRVSPGPLVGCVVVSPAGEVVGEGFYLYEEVKHAETMALQQAGERARGGCAYVSLEPHAHYGRTSPCTDALIAAGIKRVVAPIKDLNRQVSGKGFAHLRAAGLEVLTGLMARQAEQLNEKYLHYMRTGLPFVHLKLAVSLDGKIATRSGDSRWVASGESRARAHELRHEYDAILVGAGTAAIDDPLLTDRSGLARRLPLVRIVLDDALNLSAQSQLARTAAEVPVIVFTTGAADPHKIQQLEAQNIEVVKSDSRDVLPVLEELGSRSMLSVLVEGGGGVAGNFMDAGLVNKVTFFIAPKIVGGREAPGAVGGVGVEKMVDAIPLEDMEIVRRGADVEITGYPAVKALE